MCSEESANAVLEQILKSVREQSVLADRRHEVQAAFNTQVSQQLKSISKQLAVSPTAASAPEAAESMQVKVARECGGDISSSQVEILANATFLRGDNVLPASDEEEEVDEEVFSSPPDAIQQQDDPATVYNLPTPSNSKSKSRAHPDDDDVGLPAKKLSVCLRGARISTPTPSPSQQQEPEPEDTAHVDPLDRAAVLMIPTKITDWCSSPSPVQDCLALCRRKGLI